MTASPKSVRLAQVNIARLRADLDDAVMGGFLAALGPVNRLAEASPGFVWRLRSAANHGATTLLDGDELLLVNVSLWVSYEQLHAFVYRSGHGAYLTQRARWCTSMPGPTTALWWTAPEPRPSAEDALRRLRHLRAHGPTPQAFSVRRRFEPDGRPAARRSTKSP